MQRETKEMKNKRRKKDDRRVLSLLDGRRVVSIFSQNREAKKRN